jgi:hypothetical protein
VNHQVAAIGDGQALDLIEGAECERGRNAALLVRPRYRACSERVEADPPVSSRILTPCSPELAAATAQ